MTCCCWFCYNSLAYQSPGSSKLQSFDRKRISVCSTDEGFFSGAYTIVKEDNSSSAHTVNMAVLDIVILELDNLSGVSNSNDFWFLIIVDWLTSCCLSKYWRQSGWDFRSNRIPVLSVDPCGKMEPFHAEDDEIIASCWSRQDVRLYLSAAQIYFLCVTWLNIPSFHAW